MQHWPPRWHGAQEPVDEERAAVARRAKDVARIGQLASSRDRDRLRHPILYITRLKIKMCREKIAEGGKLVGHPSHHRLLLLCASQCHNSLLVLDKGDEAEGIRGSPG